MIARLKRLLARLRFWFVGNVLRRSCDRSKIPVFTRATFATTICPTCELVVFSSGEPHQCTQPSVTEPPPRRRKKARRAKKTHWATGSMLAKDRRTKKRRKK